MADNFSNNSNNLLSSTPSSTAVNSAQQSNPSISPWEEDLDLPEESPRGAVVGSLNPNTNVQPMDSTPKQLSQFAIPDDKIATNSMPTMVQASDYQNADTPTYSRGLEQEESLVQNNAQNGMPVNLMPVVGEPVLPDVAENNVNELTSTSPSISEQSDSESSLPRNPDVISNMVDSVPVEQNKTKKPNLFSRLNFWNKTAKPNESNGRSEAQSGLGVQKNAGNKKIVFIVSSAIVGLIAGLCALTENGFLSIGLENIYGSVGLEKLWGGLGKDTESALARSLLSVSKSESLDIKGDIVLIYDTASDSKVIDPLLSKDIRSRVFTKIYQKAFFTVLTDYTTSDNTDTDFSSSDSLYDSSGEDSLSSEDSNYSIDSDESSDSTTSSDTETTNLTDDQSDQEEESSFESASSSTSEISASFEGKVANNGSDLNFKINRAIGEAELSLKANNGKAWVKSSDVKYDENATSDSWVEFDLTQLNDKQIISDFFNISDMQDMSVSGRRIGSEMVSGARSYKYSIDSFEIGSSFEKFGITSGMVQSITGNAWVGIRDKTLKKIDLKITTALQSQVSQINIGMEFSGLGEAADFSEPSSEDILIPSTTSNTDTTETEQQNSSTNNETETENPVVTISNDESRRNNLVAIKDALQKYKVQNGKYPVSKELTNLSVSSNIVESALVPTHISTLPRDPNYGSGWFYGYKSVDGSSFYLTARMDESSSDTKLVDGIHLYFLYNN